MNRQRWIVAAVLSVVLAGCRFGGAPPGPTPTAVAEGTPVPSPTAVRTGVSILAEGAVQPAQPAVPLAFETGGRLLTIDVAPGDLVQAGDRVATLDDADLQEAVVEATLQVDQAQNSLAQAQLKLDDLLNWEVDDTAVALAEANLAAAEAALAHAETQDASAGSGLTSARIAVEQAERGLADAQQAYDTAFDPGREWEYHIVEPSCLMGQGGPVPCTGPSLHVQMKAEREGATRALEHARENLEIARAQYNLAAAGLNNDTAIGAQASVINARQTLQQAQQGPKASDIAAARLQVEQAELALQQSQLGLDKAQKHLDAAQLRATAGGTVLSVEAAPGMLVAAGTPIVTVLDAGNLLFQTNNLSERDLAQIAPGQTAVVTLKAYPDDPITAVVVRIGLQAGAAVGDAATFPVILRLEAGDLAIRPGMTGRVELEPAE